MWRSKKLFITAAAVLALVSTVDAEVILTLNGLDATMECPEVEGKDNLVIAVAGDAEIDPNAYHIEAADGVLEVKADTNAVSQQAYSFSFGGELKPGTIRLIANNDMAVGGTSVEAGEAIYKLVLFYDSEADTVTGFGFDVNSANFTYMPPMPEPQAEAAAGSISSAQAAEAEGAAAFNPAPETKAYLGYELGLKPGARSLRPLPKQTAEKMSRLRHFSEASEGLSFKDWGAVDDNYTAELSSYLSTMLEAGPSFTETRPATFENFAEASAEGGEGGYEMLSVGDGSFTEIEKGTVITENTIWDSNMWLLGGVEVNNAMLIIKPGVEIRIVNDEDGIVVRNNGCIIANGTPDEMINIFPVSGPPYQMYHYAIILEETASPLCEISYCTIYYAYYGIGGLNKRLETPIHDNSIWFCMAGIIQDGPKLTDVINNEVINPIYAGIRASLTDANGVASNTTEILIENNTITGYWYYGLSQDFGIVITGVEEPNDAGTVIIANNVIAGSYGYAMYLVNGWMQTSIICNGFYLNNHIMNVPGGGSMGEYVHDANSITVENFNGTYTDSYPNRLRDTWKDYSTLPVGWQTSAAVIAWDSGDEPDFVLDGNSMQYQYKNHLTPYYSEARADTTDLPSGIGTDWTGRDVNTLTLYFYGQFDNDVNEQMYVKLTDGDEVEGEYVVDNFNKTYGEGTPNRLRDTWKDHWTQSDPQTRAVVTPQLDPNYDGPQAMQYNYQNHLSPYYSEARATTSDLDIATDWAGLGAEVLVLWFYGKATNDANEQMYITVTDGGGVSGRVDYPDMNEIREEWWHEWIIELQEFVDDNSVDLSNVAQITIGFGVDDGIDPGNSPAGDGIVYFDDIWLYEEYPPAVKHTVKVPYNSSQYSLMSEWWHVWNIPFSEIDINLANVTQIAIGFGDGRPPYSTTGEGTVYFDEIILGQGPAEGPFYDGAVELDEDPFVFGYYWYPLFLKPGCPLIDAGLGYIDEYPYLLGKASCVYVVPDTNNLHGVPDTNVVNIGCHYFDWHYSNAGGDGNLFPADLTGDKIANLKDFAVLAGYWRQSTLEKNDIDRSRFVDYNDLEILAYQWLRTAIVNPQIDVNAFGDANNGFAEFGASGYTPDTMRIFLLEDGQYVGEIFGFWDGDTLGIDVSEFGGGEKQFKVVSVDSYNHITCSNITNVEFSCPLNYCFVPSSYEPNKPLCFSAFNPSEGDVTVEAYADCGNLVWSQTYGGDSILGSIPAEITNQYDFDYINFDVGGGEMLKEGDGTAMASEGGGAVGKVTDTVKPPSDNVRALIIAPDWYLRLIDSEQISKVKAAFKARGINYATLSWKNATYDKVKEYARKQSIRYMYIDAHGKYKLEKEGVLRTSVRLYDIPVVSIRKSDYYVPSWCTSLNRPGGKFWEERTESFYSMGFYDLEFVYSDCCYSGRLKINENNKLVEGQPGEIGQAYDGPQSDMSFALGMDEDSKTRVYQGWYGVSTGGIVYTSYQRWTQDEWDALGDGENLEMALEYAILHQWWGFEDPCAPVNSFRFKGQGLFVDIRLTDN